MSAPAPAGPVGGEHGEAGRPEQAGEGVEMGTLTGLAVEGEHYRGPVGAGAQHAGAR